MDKKIINIFKMIKSNKRYKYTLIVIIMLLFISIIGYSLSIFNKDNSMLVANIKVNDLVFNMTTNSGESDDRILRLQAGKTESFYVRLKNLNKIDAKYELKFIVCSDSVCTNTSSDLPNNVRIFADSNVNGQITSGNDNIVEIELFTINSSSNDVYIKLDLNAGYTWNDLALDNQIELISLNDNKQNKIIDILAYVDGIEAEEYPRSCNYLTKIKGYNGDIEVSIPNSYVVCDRKTNTWKMVVDVLVKKIVINFTYKEGAPAFTYTGNFEIANGDNADWKIYFLTSGTLTFIEEPPRIDVFLVGGGGGGGQGWNSAGAGGGGGYTKTVTNVVISNNKDYAIVVGEGGTVTDTAKSNDGGSSSAFGFSVSGGQGGGGINRSNINWVGGNGGSGGANYNNTTGAGSDGSNATSGGTGQGTTTREFGESTGKLYSAGGQGGDNTGSSSPKNPPIDETGGAAGVKPPANRGGGGGGSNHYNINNATAGGSGVLVIRTHIEDL